MRYLFLVLLLLTGCNDTRPDIVKAASLGRTDEVVALLDQGAPVDQPYPDEQRTLLHYACKRGAPELVGVLLERGADVKVKDAGGMTPFDLALNLDQHGPRASSGQVACAVQLLKAGHQVDAAADAEGLTFLHRMAQEVDSSALIEALVASGQFDANAPDANGWTALHHAAYHGNYESCVALLASGADVNAETTKQVGRSHQKAGSTIWDYRYEAGSRPLDVYRQTSTRGASVSKLLEEHGGTKNPDIDNLRRP